MNNKDILLDAVVKASELENILDTPCLVRFVSAPQSTINPLGLEFTSTTDKKIRDMVKAYTTASQVGLIAENNLSFIIEEINKPKYLKNSTFRHFKNIKGKEIIETQRIVPSGSKDSIIKESKPYIIKSHAIDNDKHYMMIGLERER